MADLSDLFDSAGDSERVRPHLIVGLINGGEKAA